MSRNRPSAGVHHVDTRGAAVDGSVDKSVENLTRSGEKCPHPVDILGTEKSAENDCRKALVHVSVSH